MPTFAENFVAEIHNKNPDTTDINEVAKNCNLQDFEDDEDHPDSVAGIYYFQDGSKAGVRFIPDSDWTYDAWTMK